MIEPLQALWFLCLLIISGFHLFVFRLKNVPSATVSTSGLPGVSIIIAFRNGVEELRKNLYEIIQQDYPVFEVILVDDHSDSEQRKDIEHLISQWMQIKIFTSDGDGKKQALLKGVSEAKYDFCLFTDADCKPASRNWVRTMMLYNHGLDTVIGYSPYQKFPGGLNLLIRFETLMTGMQYASWAAIGKPYMGVGRNVLYPKSLLIKYKPFEQFPEIPYGDDDLGLQSVASHTKIRVCLEKAAHVISKPATTWYRWLKQKHRHLSAGHYYRGTSWWQPGLFALGLIGHWMLLPFLLVELQWWNWIPVFAIGISIRWLNYHKWTDRLGDKDTAVWYPFLEIGYAAYLALMGTVTAFVKKTTWN